MKREFRNAIREGINASELNGYKWTITANGLHWNYGESFTFTINRIDEEESFLIVKAENSGETMVGLIVGSSRFCDCHTLEDAYRIATKATIRNAYNIY